ncbi:hypothetical protein H310_05838 [Aphanomyces invadans]|uniref:Uncharacterized protein n=1 Tax=Aphanomyces invadans TaxID=157072 RepID=A0A024U7U3_9STRA|nr:hypothetical protein H310_05838 [Aphanomyces invadans]ETW02290.1 hypothetical protein H310_05838 [Aphanomyces invadans]|eukprot:XP_008868895.1 hypothetical protein H310_05838 [Aphanomyces invadans]
MQGPAHLRFLNHRSDVLVRLSCAMAVALADSGVTAAAVFVVAHADEMTKIKALFSEIVRLGVARSQDMALLCNNDTPCTEAARFGLECQFREEWRTSREDETFNQLQQLLCEIEPQDHHDLHNHFRLAMETIVATVGVTDPKPHRFGSKQQHLYRAVHLDNALRQMEGCDASPLDICREMVRSSRHQFQQLLAGADSLAAAEPAPETSCNQALDGSSSAGHLRMLYENVAAAKPVNLSNAPPSKEFTRLLEAQRWAELSKANEELAQRHKYHLVARRIQRRFRLHRTSVREQERVINIRLRLEIEAASRIQRQCRRWMKWRRFKSSRLVFFRRKNLAIRISTWLVFRYRFRKCCRRFRDDWIPRDFSMETTDAMSRAAIKAPFEGIRQHVEYIKIGNFTCCGDGDNCERIGMTAKRSTRYSTCCPYELVEWHRMLTLEKEQTQAAIVAEHKAFTVEWEKYSAELTKQCLKAKLFAEWVPQLDNHSGNTYYLNVHRQLALKLLAKQRRRAESQFQERLRRLEGHFDHITTAQTTHQAEIERAICLQWGWGTS